MGQPLDRRTLIGAGAGLLAPSWAGSGARAQEALGQAPPMRCADFLDSIGVNTHLRYEATQYNDVAAVIAAMRHVGFRYARDTAPDAHRPNASHYETFARAGLSLCVFWGVMRTMQNALGDVGALAAAHPGAVHALEGPNEISAKFAYGGETGIPAAQKFMTDMRAGASQIPGLRGLPVVNFTSFRPAAGDCDYANQHPYPKAGAQPRERIRNAWEKQVGPQGAMPGKPMMFTEFGYHTLVGKPARPGHWQGVTEELQAVLLINGWLDAVTVGIRRVYIYQLLDGQRENPQPSQENHFGLFRTDGSPKPAATAFKTLVDLLADPGPRARVFTPAAMPLQVRLDPSLSCLKLQAATGAGFLLLWNESPVWDPAAVAPVPVKPVIARVTLAKPRPLSAIDVIEPSRAKELGTTSSAEIAVGLHPVVLHLR